MDTEHIPSEKPDAELSEKSPLCAIMLKKAVEDAYYLHTYAISSGKDVDVAISEPIVAAARMAAEGSESLVDAQAEVRFSTAYRKLAAIMSPVTIESLQETESHPFFGSDRKIFSKLRQITFLLPLASIILLLFILSCEIVQSIQISALKDINTKESQLKALIKEADDLRKERKISEPSSDGNSRKEKELGEKIGDLEDQVDALTFEIKAGMSMMNSVFGYLKEDLSSPHLMQLYALKIRLTTVIDVLNRLLPILYGALGAAAYIIRVSVPYIRNRTFQWKHAGSLTVRISLGMLSGVAIQWFLISDQIERAIPSSGLAFLAGYSVDLLFNIMEGIIQGVRLAKNPKKAEE